MTDVVALYQRYAELLKIERHPTSSTAKMAAQLEMCEIRMSLAFSSLDFFETP